MRKQIRIFPLPSFLIQNFSSQNLETLNKVSLAKRKHCQYVFNNGFAINDATYVFPPPLSLFIVRRFILSQNPGLPPCSGLTDSRHLWTTPCHLEWLILLVFFSRQKRYHNFFHINQNYVRVNLFRVWRMYRIYSRISREILDVFW